MSISPIIAKILDFEASGVVRICREGVVRNDITTGRTDAYLFNVCSHLKSRIIATKIPTGRLAQLLDLDAIKELRVRLAEVAPSQSNEANHAKLLSWMDELLIPVMEELMKNKLHNGRQVSKRYEEAEAIRSIDMANRKVLFKNGISNLSATFDDAFEYQEARVEKNIFESIATAWRLRAEELKSVLEAIRDNVDIPQSIRDEIKKHVPEEEPVVIGRWVTELRCKCPKCEKEIDASQCIETPDRGVVEIGSVSDFITICPLCDHEFCGTVEVSTPKE